MCYKYPADWILALIHADDFRSYQAMAKDSADPTRVEPLQPPEALRIGLIYVREDTTSYRFWLVRKSCLPKVVLQV